MFTLGIRSQYEAAHLLRNYEGPCARLHGHRYDVEVILEFEELDEAGISYDFMEADALLQSITGELDHQNLNDLEVFRGVETSAENQAHYIYRELKRRMAEHGRHLRAVRVWETARHWAQYSERPHW
jgi:6-pyruvoyltetrahydropterin/6-carboxytetrahydropterin synthase